MDEERITETADQNNDDDATCLDIINDEMEGQSGIVNVALDTAKEKVVIDFDPQETSGAQIFQIAQDLAPVLHSRWSTCTMRLERHGGRACESCALALEDRVSNIEGVHRATASYLGGVLSVTYDDEILSSDELKDSVQQLGIPIEPSAAERLADKPITDKQISTLDRWRQRLQGRKLEAAFVVITFVAMVLGLIFDRFLDLTSLATVSYVIAYVTGGYFGIRAGLGSLRLGKIDVDVLMVLAALGAAYIGAAFEGAMLLFLFALSNVLQNFALDRTRSAIESLVKIRPSQAMIRRGDRTYKLPIEKVNVGDHLIVRPGESLPLDGVVLEGASTIDQSPLTGESMPVSKGVGDTVLAGTINLHGSLEVGVTRLAKDTTIAKMIQLVEEAQSEKAQTQRAIDKIEQYYATGVVVMTMLAIIIPFTLMGESLDAAFFRAISLMVAASPCALVISTPATVLSAIGNGARNGVLFKGGVYVEQLATIKVVAFDKTGTLTEGKPVVTDVIPLSQNNLVEETAVENWKRPESEEELLRLAATIESRSEHPLAKAIVAKANKMALNIGRATSFEAASGLGVRAQVDGHYYLIGNQRLLQSLGSSDLNQYEGILDKLQSEGKTSILIAREADNQSPAVVLGVIGISDVLRPKAAAVVDQLRTVGVERVVMLTGDNEMVARPVAEAAGVDAVYAELLPQDKMDLLHQLDDEYGPVAMVGDGVNDAPALAAATVGIAMGAAGTDVAMETADVVLMADELEKIPYVFALSRKTRKTLFQNLFFAFAMILFLVLAVLRVQLPLPLAVIGHEGSTVLVSLNGLKLLRYRPKLS